MSRRKLSDSCELENVRKTRSKSRAEQTPTATSAAAVTTTMEREEENEATNDSDDVQLVAVVENSSHEMRIYDNVELNDREQLTNIHIYSFLRLLRRQFPHINGLCPPDPPAIRAYAHKPLANSVFIFNACGDHWVTISNVNVDDVDYWHVYDSYRYEVDSFRDFFRLIYPERSSVFIRKISVQMQRGLNDCGLFALAFATSLCFGDDPSQMQYVQKSFRKHYRGCLQANHALCFDAVYLTRSQMEGYKRRTSQRAIHLELD